MRLVTRRPSAVVLRVWLTSRPSRLCRLAAFGEHEIFGPLGNRIHVDTADPNYLKKINNLLFILVIVSRWHCMICLISLLHSPSLPSLFLHVDLQPHYHSTGNAITSPLVFLSTSSSVLFPRSLSLPSPSPPCKHIHFHPSPILPCLETQFFCCFSFTCFMFAAVHLPSARLLFPLSSSVFPFPDSL